MILVCVSHVRTHFVDDAPTLYFVLTSITRIATPTFLLLSGFVAAYVLVNGGPRTKITLVDRGIFVLLVGHFLLNLDEVRSLGLAEWILGRVTVTDAIGICLVCAVLLYRLPSMRLALLGLAFAFLSWPIAMTQTFDSPLARHLGAVLINLRSDANSLVDAAVVPYLGVFIIGMALSKACTMLLRAGEFRRVAKKLALIGSCAVGIVMLALLCWFVSKRLDLVPTDLGTAELLRKALDPRSKLPPGPAYFLFYGGCGLLMTAACLVAKPRTLQGRFIDWVSTLGRASMMCFILQDWLLKVLPAGLGFDALDSIAFWVAYLCCAILILHWAASQWDARRANRFLTIGLKRAAPVVVTKPSAK
jgi:hypothetical protein